jgi:hypothetical protein
MGSELRRNDRNDPVVRDLASDETIMQALSDRSRSRKKSMRDRVEAALTTEDKRLVGWVTVAVWEDGDGKMTESVMGDEHSSPLEVKGMLHDAVWSTAHAE